MHLDGAGEAELRARPDHLLHRVQDDRRQRGLVNRGSVIKALGGGASRPSRPPTGISLATT
jgi:hypothetical protein